MPLTLEHIDDTAEDPRVARALQAINRCFQLLSRLTPDFGPLSVSLRVGATTVTWAGASPAASATVTHGLGKTPAAVLLSGNSNAPYAVQHSGSVGATTFNLFVRDVDNATPANGTTKLIWWLVIG